eukprot:3159953-Alexandrium_andersonii.AAC.1
MGYVGRKGVSHRACGRRTWGASPDATGPVWLGSLRSGLMRGGGEGREIASTRGLESKPRRNRPGIRWPSAPGDLLIGGRRQRGS